MLDTRVSTAIADVFGVDPATVTPEAGPETIADWDSIGHFKLILHLEEVFGIRFPANEIGSLRTAGQIQEALTSLKVLP
jgi:acyl carrier protein